MKKLLSLILTFISFVAVGQGLSIKSGDQFPSIGIDHIINAPLKSVNLATTKDAKYYVLNFWGTWCSPCIPEMEALAKLQEKNGSKLQVIGISDDETSKLQKFLKTRPSKIWLATDTNFLLYNVFNFSSVSHSVIINPKREVVALVKTHSITQGLLDSLYRGEKIKSDADLKEKPVNTSADLFAVDSTLNNSFTFRSYMIGQQSMGRMYGDKSPYAKRRLSFINSSIVSMFKTAYDIVSSNQIVYEIDEKKVTNYEDKSLLYCLDLLVSPDQKDSLYVILQNKLKEVSPVKMRIEYRTTPVYVLTNQNFNLPVSTKVSSYGFSGRGYDGTAVKVSDFANNYLSNELPLPVVDETNLQGQYDIKTTLDARTREQILKSIEQLGLKIEKQERKMKTLIFY